MIWGRVGCFWKEGTFLPWCAFGAKRVRGNWGNWAMFGLVLEGGDVLFWCAVGARLRLEGGN